MTERETFELLAHNPRADFYSRGLYARFQFASVEKIESECLSDLEERLAFLCALYFVLRPNRWRTIAVNDCFTLAVMCAVIVRSALGGAEDPGDDQKRCCELIASLLHRAGTKRHVAEARPELTAAFVLACVLRRSRTTTPLQPIDLELANVDAIGPALLRCAALSEMLRQVQERFLLETPEGAIS